MATPTKSSAYRVGRRPFLKAAGVGATGLLTGLAGCARSKAEKFPPEERTEHGESGTLGGGEISTFISHNEDYEPTFVGVQFSGDVLDGLPTDESVHLHLDLPTVNPSNYEWVGIDWNPAGHPPQGVYTAEHFDFHFYTMVEADVEKIPFGFAAYDIPAEQRPEGYITESEAGAPGRVIAPAMGEHLLDSNAPEFNGEDFSHTYIYGVYDPSIDPANPDETVMAPMGEDGEEIEVPVYGGDGAGELIFGEPMITKAFLETKPEIVTTEIGTPDTYAVAGHYPTEYGIRYQERGDLYTVTLQGFEDFDAAGT